MIRWHETLLFPPGRIWARQLGGWGISNGVTYSRSSASSTVAHYFLVRADTKSFVQAHRMQTLYLFNFVFVNRALSEAVTYIASKVCCWDRTNPVDNRRDQIKLFNFERGLNSAAWFSSGS